MFSWSILSNSWRAERGLDWERRRVHGRGLRASEDWERRVGPLVGPYERAREERRWGLERRLSLRAREWIWERRGGEGRGEVEERMRERVRGSGSSPERRV